MKKNLILLIVLILCTSTAKALAPEQKDKNFLIQYFQETRDNLLKSIEGLNETQMQFRSSPESWSGNQILEHIVQSEKYFFDMAQKFLEQPENPEKINEIKIRDQEMIENMTDRSKKAEAPEFLQPKGTFSTKSEAVQAFTDLRSRVIEFIKETPEDDLRNHIMESPTQDYYDAFQFLLYMAGHTSRHTQQLEELKESPDFPVHS